MKKRKGKLVFLQDNIKKSNSIKLDLMRCCGV